MRTPGGVALLVLSLATSGCMYPGLVSGQQRAEGAEASPATSSGAATPRAAARFVNTGKATNLAIEGDAYFVLSTRVAPQSVGDLLFTRRGDFEFTRILEPQDPAAPYRLVDGKNAFVMGYSLKWSGPPGQTIIPREGWGRSMEAFQVESEPSGTPVTFGSLSLPRSISTPPASALVILHNGQLKILRSEDEVVASDGSRVVQFVAVVRFANPAGLARTPDGSYLRYTPDAGDMNAGIAGAGPERGVGKDTVLRSSVVEAQ